MFKFKLKLILAGIIAVIVSVAFISMKNLGMSLITIVVFLIYGYYQKYRLYKEEKEYQRYVFEREEENNKNLRIIAEETKRKNNE